MPNARALIEFCRTPGGRFLLFLLVGGILIVVMRGCKDRGPLVNPQPRRAELADFLAGSENRKTVPLRPVPKPPESKPPVPTVTTATVERLPPIHLYAAPFVEPIDSPAEYAPFGRLIRCELVITVDSANIATPIIGLVLEDVWYKGQLIIPAGAEVHGRAQVDRIRERIASQASWTIVLPSGMELTVSGTALDHEPRRDGSTWDIRDGSAGLRGQVLKSDNLAEIKLFVSAALAGAAEAFKQNQQTVYGLQPLPTAQNAALSGAGQVLSSYAQQIHETIEREGIFVRVPSGKQFYLYVTETIDLSKARVAGTRAYPETRADAPVGEVRPGKSLVSSLSTLPVQPNPVSRP